MGLFVQEMFQRTMALMMGGGALMRNGGEPQMMRGEPSIMPDEPRMMPGEPRMMPNEPRMMPNESRMMGSQERMSGGRFLFSSKAIRLVAIKDFLFVHLSYFICKHSHHQIILQNISTINKYINFN